MFSSSNGKHSVKAILKERKKKAMQIDFPYLLPLCFISSYFISPVKFPPTLSFNSYQLGSVIKRLQDM